MTVHQRLPFELRAHVASFLFDDRQSLVNLSLASHALDTICKPHIFATMDFRNLNRDSLLPFRHYIRELRITWNMDMFRASEARVLERSLLPYISSDVTPRLQSVVIRSIGSEGTAYLSTLEKAFSPLHSLTTLTLDQTVHKNLCELLALVCSFPYLKHLYIRGATWHKAGSEKESALLAPLQERPHLETLSLSATHPDSTFLLAQWLAQTPSAEILSSLRLPFEVDNSPSLALFGPSVHHLSTPMHQLQPSSLGGYTALVSLTLLLHEYNAQTGRRDELPAVLSSLPAPQLLRILVLELRLIRPYDQDVSGFIHYDSLVLADRILHVGCECGRDSTRPGFSALKEVEFRVCNSEAFDCEKRARVEEGIKAYMPYMHRLGRLSVIFEE